MIKAIIFDLDGVLIEAKQLHYDALNLALSEINNKFVIDWDEHLRIYDGLKTHQKLDMLVKSKGLPENEKNNVWNRKQQITLDLLKDIKHNLNLISVFEVLSKSYKIVCCSNSIRKSVLTMLSKLGIIEYFDLILSNEDVKNSKPHPEIYWKAISMLGMLPDEVIIVEDSPHGLLSAYKSTKNVMRVKNPNDVTLKNIHEFMTKIENTNKPKWVDKKMNVLIPMAGAGSRFEKAGYTFPKPLIEVNNKPMIQVVVENLNIDANFIFVVQKSHRIKYNLDSLLNLIAPNCKIVEVDGITDGAACTTLLAKEYIDNDNPLLMANSDQFLDWDSNEFLYKMNETNCDGGIVTFEATHPKWSFVKIDNQGYVTEVAEKNPISNIATVGLYYWKHGKDYVNSAEQMIEKNIRVNGEFYVCPVFNEAILNSKKIKIFNIERMWGLGTPEDLNIFLNR